jgi:hypothetical protein
LQTKGLKLPSKALIIFGPSHVRVYELDGTTLLEEWEYSSISSFTRMADGWVIVVGDLFKPEVYTFQSPWVRARSLFRARFIIITISPLIVVVVVVIRRRRSTRCTSASWPRPSGRHKREGRRESHQGLNSSDDPTVSSTHGLPFYSALVLLVPPYYRLHP